MLRSFPAILAAGTDPVSSADAARVGRLLRDLAAVRGLDHAFDRAGPRVRPISEPHCYRYRVRTQGAILFQGLAGVMPLGDLVPHEDTYAHGGKPTPPVEIRPLLGVTRDRLPDLEEIGPAVSVRRGPLLHEVTAVEGSGHLAGGTVVLADGHHRRRAALRDRGPDVKGLVLVVGDDGKGLVAGAFQRVVRGHSTVPDEVREAFDVEPIAAGTPRVAGIVWVEGGGSTWLLRARSDALDDVPGPLRAVPSALAGTLLFPSLGIDEDELAAFATAPAAVGKLTEEDSAVLLPPVAIPAVLDAAEAGVVFPPKATRFRPKPVRGLLMRAV